MSKSAEIFPTLLRNEGLKATPGRVAILKILAKSQKPLSIHSLKETLGNQLDMVTIYRALEALIAGKLVQRVDFGHVHAHYEVIEKNRHHHHLICKICGRVEDIAGCVTKNLEKIVLVNSKSFKNIISHSVELSGMCKQCVRT